MAYAAVISLKQTISGLLNSSQISLIFSTRQILESAYNHTTSLLQLLNRSSGRRSRERLTALDWKIRDYAHELEDVLELHELNPQHEEIELRKAIASFSNTLKKVEVKYIEELSKLLPQHDDDDVTAPSYTDFGVEMVGHSKVFKKIRESLLFRIPPHNLCFFLLHGEPGCGRKIVANTIFEDLGKSEQFDCCAWVKIGTKYRLQEVLLQILLQVYNNLHHYDMLIWNEDEDLLNYLCHALKHRRYMIVLDDVRDVHIVDYLKSSLPNRSDGSVVFVTSNLWEEFFQLADAFSTFVMPSQYFEEMVMSLLCLQTFGYKPIPQEFEEAGKDIVKNMRGLLISAAKTLLYLYKIEKTVEEWRKIAADKENPIFIVGDEISERCTINVEKQHNVIEESDVQEISALANMDHPVKEVLTWMHPERFFSKMQIISLLGMAGIGKSTVARKIFEDPSIVSHFDHRVWVTLGPKFQSQEVLMDILAQAYPSIDKKHMEADAELTQNLCAQLSDKRCLIVLDDLWSKEPLCHLKNVFPDIMGTTLVTSRLAEEAEFGKDDILLRMDFLDKEESWCLLRKKVFGEGFCSSELEKAGRKIAENCDGLPLLILTVADQLLKGEMTTEFWNNVASGKKKSVFENAHDEISKGLLPSYEILPQNLKACFLYIGAFRNRYDISTSNLTNLWISEGFLTPNLPQTVEDFAAECLSELVDKSLVMAERSRVSDFQIKTCRLHPIFWHLSNSEAVKNKFFHGINCYADCSIDSIQSQRRLCIRNNIVLGLKIVKDSMAFITTTRSLLCVGPPHQYQVPINFNLRLLRVMDALTIRLYEFPIEVVKLVHLRYLGLTCNGNLPSSISSLWKLQYLIVKRYMSIKSSKNFIPLPVEIWDMEELIHLQVVGGRLPNPKYGGGLPKLSTLLDVSIESCTKKVLRRIPNLKRLGIRIELVPNDKGNPFRCLNRISHLRRLESLKCIVVNPQINSEVVAPPRPVSMFPSSLKKLSLSGFGYPWEYMTIIGRLKNLEVLKLKHYAFQGPKWVVDDYQMFKKLNFLLVDDTDLEQWQINTFLRLKRLSIKHCYKLRKVPMNFIVMEIRKIEIVDCNPSIVTWAQEMRQLLPQKRFPAGEVDVDLSWLVPRSKFAS